MAAAPLAPSYRILGVFVLMLGALAAEAWWRQQQQQQLASSRSSLGGRFAAAASSSGSGAQLQAAAGGTQALSSHAQQQATDAIMCGLEAGACFGFSAAACRIGFVLTFQVRLLLRTHATASASFFSPHDSIFDLPGVRPLPAPGPHHVRAPHHQRLRPANKGPARAQRLT